MKIVRKIIQIKQVAGQPFEYEALLMECSKGHQFISDEIFEKNCKLIKVIHQNYRTQVSTCPQCGEDTTEITQLGIAT